MILREYNLDGNVAIITGAGQGIGKGIALTLAEAGANIVAVDWVAKQINETAEEIGRLGRECLPIIANVTKSVEVESMVKQTISKFKKIDVLVNNVGAVMVKPLVPLPGDGPPGAGSIPDFFTPTTVKDWHRIIETNLTSVFLCTRAVGPHMLERQYGRIINISSMAGIRGRIYRSVYGASKSAVAHFTKSMALEWGRYNITANAIAPGVIFTPMNQRVRDNEKLLEKELRPIPLKRGGEPREIGLLVVYLASKAGSFMTGQIISLDGGQSI